MVVNVSMKSVKGRIYYVNFINMVAKAAIFWGLSVKKYARILDMKNSSILKLKCVVFPQTVSNDSDTFEAMESKKISHFLLLILTLVIATLAGCKTAENQTPESGKKLPGTVAITPSSFRCEGIVIESDSKSINFKVAKMLEQGSSLFFSVSAGDTLVANFQSQNKTNYPAMKKLEMLIEERVMLNSEKPEFIIRQIKDE